MSAETIVIYPSEITFTLKNEKVLHGYSYLFVEIDEKTFEEILTEIIKTIRQWYKEIKQYYEEHPEEY